MKQPLIIRLQEADIQRLPELAGDIIELANMLSKTHGVTKPQAINALKVAVLYDIRNQLSCICEELESKRD